MDFVQFIPSPTVLAAFTVAGLVLNVTPGPDMTLSVSRTLAHGVGSGMSVLLGTTTGCLVHTLAVATGLSLLLAASPTAFAALKIAGALYLLWLAFVALSKGSAFNIAASTRPRNALWRDFGTGLWINLLNPKIVIFYLTFLPQFVSPNDPDAAGKLLFLGLWFGAVALIPMTAMILFAHRLASLLRARPRIARLMDWLFATVFATFAIRIVLDPGR